MGRHRRERRERAGRIAVAFASALLLVAGTGHAAYADLLPPLPIPPLPPPLGPGPEEPEPEPKPRPKPAPKCSTATAPFVPTTVSVPDVDPEVDVLALRRGRGDVPGSPPITSRGRSKMAFDLDSGIRPGHSRGNALLNAHTWPDGSALGNALLAELDEGDRIDVRGKGGKFCYRVTDRIEVRANNLDARKRYYAKNGSPQLALLVCSGKRLGPENWTHRTMWFAEPID